MFSHMLFKKSKCPFFFCPRKHVSLSRIRPCAHSWNSSYDQGMRFCPIPQAWLACAIPRARSGVRILKWHATHEEGVHTQVKLGWIPREGVTFPSHNASVQVLRAFRVCHTVPPPQPPSPWSLWGGAFYFSEWPVVLIFCIFQIFNHPTC